MIKKILLIAVALVVTGCDNNHITPTLDNVLDRGPDSLEEERLALRKSVADNVIAPAYANLQVALNALNQQALLDCDAGSGVIGANFRTAWQSAALAWQGISWLNFGPVADNFTALKIQFFPDANNAVQRGVDRLIAGPDAINTALIATSSVAAQGLPALEYLLFGGLAPVPIHCDAISAISANLVTLVSPIATAWAVNGSEYQAWLDGSGDYLPKNGELVEIELMASALSTAIIINSDKKLLKPIDDGAELLESAFAGLSGVWLDANTRALHHAFTGGAGYGIDDYLIRVPDEPTVARGWQLRIEAILAESGAITTSYASLIDSNNLDTLNSLEDRYQALDDFFSETVSPTLQVFLGFNSTDGD